MKVYRVNAPIGDEVLQRIRWTVECHGPSGGWINRSALPGSTVFRTV